jgi:hypothetical protein
MIVTILSLWTMHHDPHDGSFCGRQRSPLELSRVYHTFLRKTLSLFRLKMANAAW